MMPTMFDIYIKAFVGDRIHPESGDQDAVYSTLTTPMGLCQLQLVLDDSLLRFSLLKISFINQNKTSFMLPSNVVLTSD